MSTSIQETGGQITASTVRAALEIAEKDFKRRGVVGGTASVVRVQQQASFLFVVLQYYTVVHPELSSHDLAIELGAALVALQTSLNLVRSAQ